MIYLRIALFFISFLGIYQLFKKILKFDEKIVLPISVIGMSLFLYIMSIFSLIEYSFVFLFIIGFIFLIYSIFKKEFIIKDYLSIDNLLFAAFLIYIIIVSRNIHFLEFDNYSHWGLIVKIILENASLTKTMDVITYVGYPPGTSIFISYFAYICNSSSDGIFIIAQNIIVLSLLKGIFNLIDTKNKILKRILFIVSFISIHTFLISFNDLLVDSIIMLCFTFALIYLKTYKKSDYKELFICLLFTIIYLYLVKNAGLLLSIVLIVLFYKKTHKKYMTYALAFALLGAYSSWNIFAILTYKRDFFTSKHILNPGISAKMVLDKGIINCITYYLKYLTVIFRMNKEYYSNIFFAVINVLLFISFFLKRISFKKILKIDLIYLLYFIGLGLMYVFSMPTFEADYYASYERYMMVPIFIMIFCLIYDSLKNNKKLLSSIFIILMVCSLFFKIDKLKLLVGIDNYENTRMYKYDLITKYFNYNKQMTLGIYSEKNNYDGFLYCYTIYNLRTRYGIMYSDIDNVLLDKTDFIIVFDNLDKVNNILKENGYHQISDNIFKIN